MPDWRKLYDENSAALLLYARQWCANTSDAEDAVQEGFVKWWKRCSAIDSPPVALLFTSVRGAAIDRFRSGTRRSHREQLVAGQSVPAEAVFESGIEADEARRIVEHALSALPDEQREVVVLKVWGGRTFAEIASILGIPANTAASRYRYAIEALSRRLRERKDDLV